MHNRALTVMEPSSSRQGERSPLRCYVMMRAAEIEAPGQLATQAAHFGRWGSTGSAEKGLKKGCEQAAEGFETSAI